MIVVGFITSLLPTFNHNPEDAAAFAVAQEVVAQEQVAAAAQPQAGAGPGAGAGGPEQQRPDQRQDDAGQEGQSQSADGGQPQAGPGEGDAVGA